MRKSSIILAFLIGLSPMISLADNKLEITGNHASLGPYSQAIKTNQAVYISGQIPLDPATGKIISGDFRTQFQQAIVNLSNLAKNAGGSLDEIVKVNIYVKDLNNFPVINEVMAAFFHKPYPARSVVEIKDLPMHANVEIEAIMIHSAGK